jgi:hypothetical protein
MLAPVQDFGLDDPLPAFLEKQYLFKHHFVVFSAKKVIGVSKGKTGISCSDVTVLNIEKCPAATLCEKPQNHQTDIWLMA